MQQFPLKKTPAAMVVFAIVGLVALVALAAFGGYLLGADSLSRAVNDLRLELTSTGAPVNRTVAAGFDAAGIDGAGYALLVDSETGTRATNSGVDPAAVAIGYQNAFRNVARATLPTVVRIDVVEVIRQPTTAFRSPLDMFFGRIPQNPGTNEYRQNQFGSGIMVRRDGNRVFVLTNNHVVGSGSEITVTLYDERSFPAQILGADPNKDLAVVVFETDEPVSIAVMGDSDSVEPGDWAFAIGSPLGFQSTITAGIISAVGRIPDQRSNIADLTDYLQTDAPINQGNSGGALVNIFGEVIGINTWIASGTGGSVGLGFAVPINNAARTLSDIIEKGRVDYGWLGVNIGDVTQANLEDLGLTNTNGSFVYDIIKNSPAERSGVRPGDFVVSLNGQEVRSSADLRRRIAVLPLDETHEFVVVRDGRRVTLDVRTGIRQDDIANDSRNVWPGLSVVRITAEIRRQMNLSADIGSVIVGNVVPNSPAAMAGLRPGDIVRSLNNRPVTGVREFYREINSSDDGELRFRIARGNSEFILGIVR